MIEKPAHVTCSVILVSAAIVPCHHIDTLTNTPNCERSAEKSEPTKCCIQRNLHKLIVQGRERERTGTCGACVGAPGLKGCLLIPQGPGELRWWVRRAQGSPTGSWALSQPRDPAEPAKYASGDSTSHEGVFTPCGWKKFWRQMCSPQSFGGFKQARM